MTDLTTALGNSYWDGNGAYQKELEMLSKNLVPSSGEAETFLGEMIRCVSNLNHEYNNNGNGNAIEVETEQCGECWGSGEVEVEEYEPCDHCDGEGGIDGEVCDHCDGRGEVKVETYETCPSCDGEGEFYQEPTLDDYFKDMLDKLDKVEEIRPYSQKVRMFILSSRCNQIEQKNEYLYSRLIDETVKYVIKNQ